MRFGVHVGIGGNFPKKTIEQALEAGCDCIQIFAGNPRGWRRTPYDVRAWQEFRDLRKQHGIYPVVIHTSYLVNLVTADKTLQKNSTMVVAHDLEVAARSGIEYVNTHLGSYGAQPRAKGFARVTETIAKLIGTAKPGPMLLLENSAGAGNLCGGTMDELGAIIKAVGSNRVGVCLDTAHAWASGYDIHDAKGVEAFVGAVGKHIGFKRVRALHLNDTQVALGAKRDLHWHVAEGRIGPTGFRTLLRRPEFADVAVICETPKTLEDDRKNLRIARRLAGVRAVKAKT
ncbi:MAG TPA: deoxyribonuclease IV [Candidatus Eremiobacteraceae bacterium]|jgi:deoxyribonuclease-4|nr:deoxyribonuclease IV [Candidatus Eremiobacteraceae bacterium]